MLFDIFGFAQVGFMLLLAVVIAPFVIYGVSQRERARLQKPR
jgi:hypothetical protein